jgi:hypothetical protein
MGSRFERKREPPVSERLDHALCGDAIGALAGLIFRRFDAQPHLRCECSADEAANRVILPVGRFGDLGARGAVFSAQHFEHDRFLGQQ